MSLFDKMDWLADKSFDSIEFLFKPLRTTSCVVPAVHSSSTKDVLR